MGAIPQYGEQVQPNALPTPYSDARVSPDAFGAQVGGVLQEVSAELAQHAKQAKGEADTAAVIGAIGQAKASLNGIILDPQSGYASLSGTDAIKQRDDVLKRYSDAIDKAGADLKNDDQFRVFAQHAVALKEEGFRHVLAHEAVQIEHVAQAQFTGAVDATSRTMQNPAVIGSGQERDANFATLQQLAVAEAKRRFGAAAPPEAIASVLGPTLQKAALDGMEAAVASQNPATAQSALQKFAPYLGVHERFYSKTVDVMTQKSQVNAAAAAAIGAATTPVLLPASGDQPAMQIPRLDPAKTAQQIASIAPDDPLRDEKTKAIEQRQVVLDKIWDVARAQQVAAAETQGTDPATGAFSIDKVDGKLKVWLQQNAPDKLIALRALDARAQRQDNGEVRKESQLALGDLLLDMTTPGRREQFYGPMTPEQFTETLNDQPLTPLDRKGAIIEFKKIKAEAGKLTDKTTSVARESLAAAFPTNPDQAKKYLSAMLQDLNQFVAQAKAANNGKAPGDEEMRARAAYILARPPGEHWWNSPDRRIQQLVQQTSDNAKTSTTPAKAVKSYRYNKERTQRIPVYSDGSEGAKEAVQ